LLAPLRRPSPAPLRRPATQDLSFTALLGGCKLLADPSTEFAWRVLQAPDAGHDNASDAAGAQLDYFLSKQVDTYVAVAFARNTPNAAVSFPTVAGVSAAGAANLSDLLRTPVAAGAVRAGANQLQILAGTPLQILRRRAELRG
ncbi:hypothetical protein NBG98_26635, partial [Burkholderia cenocepacia]